MNSALLSIFKGQDNLNLGKVLTPSIANVTMCIPTLAAIGLLSFISFS
jgi:hypothetical protein